MATQKAKSIDLLGEIAAELGISAKALETMDVAAIRDLIASGDLDPAQKARLVRSKLSQLRDAVDLAADCLDDAIEDGIEMKGRSSKGRGGSKGSSAYADD